MVYAIQQANTHNEMLDEELDCMAQVSATEPEKQDEPVFIHASTSSPVQQPKLVFWS